MRLWAVAVSLASTLVAIPSMATLSRHQAPSLAGNWRIAFIGATEIGDTQRSTQGTLALHDTIVTVASDEGASPQHVVVGTFSVDFSPLGVDMPIGTRVVGSIETPPRMWARLGEGADRGEIELDGEFAGDSVVGRWVQVYNRAAPLPMGQFVMRRINR